MKDKKSKFWLIFINVINGCLLLLIIINFVSLFNKKLPEEITESEFANYMENKGCNLIDVQNKENYLGVDTYLVTDENSCPYLISYTRFLPEYSFDDFFDVLEEDVVNGNSNVYEKKYLKKNLLYKYYEYSTSGDYYKIVTLNKNSILYASADIKYKNEVIDIFEDFNYINDIKNNEISYIFYAVFLVIIINIISLWKIEKKIRNKGWVVLIPIYNIICLSKDVLGSSLYALLLLVPIGNIIFIFVLYYKLGKLFNKSNLFSLLLTLFPIIFLPILAFDNLVYINPKKEENIINEDIVTNQKSNTSSIKKIINAIKWFLMIIFILFAFSSLLVYLDEHLINYLIITISFLIYGLMICPKITNYTNKFKTYTKYKTLIVILLIIINLIFMSIFPV